MLCKVNKAKKKKCIDNFSKICYKLLIMKDIKEKFMKEALKEAKKAYDKLEVPIGAVIVKDNKIIARGHNLKEEKRSTIKHAEIIAIEKASKKVNNWRLNDCEMYITLEPCPMCASAIKQARIDNVYCALSNSDSNNNEIIRKIFDDNDYINKSVNFESDLCIDKSKELSSNSSFHTSL